MVAFVDEVPWLSTPKVKATGRVGGATASALVAEALREGLLVSSGVKITAMGEWEGQQQLHLLVMLGTLVLACSSPDVEGMGEGAAEGAASPPTDEAFGKETTTYSSPEVEAIGGAAVVIKGPVIEGGEASIKGAGVGGGGATVEGPRRRRNNGRRARGKRRRRRRSSSSRRAG